MNSKEFTEKYLLNEVKLIEAANVRLHLLSAMVHGIETAGALLDSLPFKAKGQGKKRFDLALRKLFANNYSEVNTELDLYNFLRSHMAHSMLPGKQIILSETKNSHLLLVDDQLQFHLPSLYNDYVLAIEKLKELIDDDQVKNKRIEFDNLHHL